MQETSTRKKYQTMVLMDYGDAAKLAKEPLGGGPAAPMGPQGPMAPTTISNEKVYAES